MSREMESLLRTAAELARSSEGDEGDDYWRVVCELHRTPSRRVLDACRDWSVSIDPRERCLGANVLGQLGFESQTKPFLDETRPILRTLLGDSDDRVVGSALIAFGHQGADESVESITPLARHPDADVRFAVVFSLLGIESASAIEAMLELSRDEDAHVRDWATFGLGTHVTLDTPAIREALVARTADSDAETRAEALAGLARLRDPRATQLLIRALESESVGSLVVESALALGAIELVEPLIRLRSRWDVDPELIDAMIVQCRKNQPAPVG